jgi:hypothetical protein
MISHFPDIFYIYINTFVVSHMIDVYVFGYESAILLEFAPNLRIVQ